MKERLEVIIDRKTGEITISSGKFPVELHDAIKGACEKYYEKYYK